MTIDADRIAADVAAIARCTATPGAGATRPTMSPAWADARAYFIGQAEACGAEVRVDAAGNVHARPAALGWEEPAWLVGSHLDSVPHGGDYDGVIGVVLGLELLRSARDEGIDRLAVEAAVFAEEEGPEFGLGMIGTRAWVGALGAAELSDLRNSDGLSYSQAGAEYGVRADALAADRLDPSRYLGLVELHIEQGPGLWRRGQRVGVVRSIAGRRQYRVTVGGEANHAGATAMPDRRDALAAAAAMVVELESLASEIDQDAVVTVGRLVADPNAVNVIAGRVVFTIDFRAPHDAALTRGDASIRQRLTDIGARRSVDVAIEQTEAIAAQPMSGRLVEALSQEAARCGVDDCPVMVSGALHDAAVLAPVMPTAMAFVASRDGVSHNPDEFSRIEDVAHAAEIVERLVRRPTLERVNAMARADVVAALGGAFEHSPWVIERACDMRPFADLDALVTACRDVLGSAEEDERLGLIRAHPDLVGRLAKAGQLTAASTHEQRAAGLEDVCDDEAHRFEGLNAAYRERFGFPFVICAREHRKEAILMAMPVRLENDRETEAATAIDEILKIARLRLADMIWENDS
ncbi:MAG: 2-oxo-4-hydroxy-4-carboxy-5-ureidoimidazoline decarboxylase [Planctomycetota bacterium]